MDLLSHFAWRVNACVASGQSWRSNGISAGKHRMNIVAEQ